MVIAKQEPAIQQVLEQEALKLGAPIINSGKQFINSWIIVGKDKDLPTDYPESLSRTYPQFIRGSSTGK